MDTHGLSHFMLFRKSEGYLVYLNEFYVFLRDRKVAERFDQPRLGRNESERWGKWTGIRKETV